MQRVLFVDAASGARAELAQELYEQRGGEARTAATADDTTWPDLVVDVDSWNLADPIGLCQAELDELRAQIARRIAELP
jgi:hypothetical protein